MLTKTIIILNWVLLFYLLYISVCYVILLIASIHDVFLRFLEIKIGDVISIMKSHNMPPVTVLMAAYNEEKDIIGAVTNVLHSDYPNTHLIVINDGSTDNTLPLLIKTFNLHKIAPIIPKLIEKTGEIKAYYVSDSHKTLTVIDKVHVDKSDSLNVGLNACRTPLFMTVDADTLLDEEAISEAVFYMMTRPHAVAVGGAAYILNGCTYKDGNITKAQMPYKPIYALQACEYLRSFVINRAGWNVLGGSLSFSGTFTLFEHKAVVEIGGFDVGNPANDFEIITHLHAHRLESDTPYQIGFTPASTAWTDVPGTLKEYWHQRTTWQRGTLRSLLLHKQLFLNPRFNIIGLFSYPFFLLGETLGPLVECSAYILVFVSWYLGIIDVYTAGLFFLACWLFVTTLTVASELISLVTYNKYKRLRDMPWILLVVTMESFGFRQFHVAARVVGTIQYFLNSFKWSKK